MSRSQSLFFNPGVAGVEDKVHRCIKRECKDLHNALEHYTHFLIKLCLRHSHRKNTQNLKHWCDQNNNKKKTSITNKRTHFLPHVKNSDVEVWLLLVWQRHHHFDKGHGEVSRLSTNGPFIPVVINLRNQGDNVAHFQGQLSLVLRLKVIQDFTARLHCRETRSNQKGGGGGGGKEWEEEKGEEKILSSRDKRSKFFQINRVTVLFAEHDS